MEKVYKFLEKINSFEGLYNISTSIRELVKDKKPTKNKQQYINYNPYYYYPYPYGYNNYYMNYYRSYKNPKKRSR